MRNARESKEPIIRAGRRCLAVLFLALGAIVLASFAAGYRLGVAHQEDSRLHEFVINAARQGILDYDRIKKLADAPMPDA